MSAWLLPLARLRELHAAPKNVINENMRYATAPQMAEYYALHEAFPVLAEAVEALRGLYLEEVNGRLCRLPDDEISDGTRREEGTCDTCARKWARVAAVLNQIGWSE